MSGFVNTLISMLETPFVGYIAAVVAGILASMSPCVISTIPIAIGYVGGYGAGDTKKTVLCATAFVLGQTVAFVSLGFLFGLMGLILASPWWRVFLALVIIVMGLNVVGLIHIPLPAVDPKVSRNSGIIGGFLIGILMATVSTPCSTPALVAILALGANAGSVVHSTVLMVFYSLGQSAFIMAAAIAAGKLPSMLAKSGLAKAGQILMKCLGVLLIVYGGYMIFDVIRYW